MSTSDPYALGYRRVDDDPYAAVLVETMDATSRWQATRRLRSWERAQLGLAEGQRLLDVGCGMADAALGLAADLGPTGEVVGVDASAEMLSVARRRVADGGPAACRMRFVLGDAASLPEPDASFDAARCERTLQWLDDPDLAVAEIARVVRPAGRVVLIDTDWSTLRLDVGDRAVEDAVRRAMAVERRRPSNIGSRLPGLVRSAGFGDVEVAAETQVWGGWDPDAAPAPEGCFSMRSLIEDLAEAGQVAADDQDRVVDLIHDAARRGDFSMSLTMFAVAATRSDP